MFYLQSRGALESLLKPIKPVARLASARRRTSNNSLAHSHEAEDHQVIGTRSNGREGAAVTGNIIFVDNVERT